MKSGTICVVALLMSGIIVIAQNRDAQAERSFETGREAFDARRWEPAAARFEQSYQLHPHPLTAYFLCLVYAHLERAAQTRDYAQKALRGSPPLSNSYRAGAQLLLDRVSRNLSPIWQVSTSAAADTNTATIPREKTLNLPRDVSAEPEASGIFELRSKNSNLCLDVWTASREAGDRLAQSSCHGGGNQQFRLEGAGQNQYLLVAQHSGQCLDVAEEKVDDGASIVQYPCHGRPNQRFRFDGTADEGFEVIAVHSNKCLDVWEESHEDGADIRQYQCHGRPNQRWVLRRVR